MDDRIKKRFADVEIKEEETDEKLRTQYLKLKNRVKSSIYLLYAGAETLEAIALTKRPDYNDADFLNRRITLLLENVPQFEELIKPEDYNTTADYVTNDVLYEYLIEEQHAEEILTEHFEEIAEHKDNIGSFAPDNEDYKKRLALQFAAAAAITSRTIIDGVIRGNTVTEMTKQVSDLDQKLQKRTKRIIYTEDTWIINEDLREDQEQKEQEEKKEEPSYIYTTMRDSRVCPVCIALDGIEFKYADKKLGINYPPMHPWCRCIAIPKEKK